MAPVYIGKPRFRASNDSTTIEVLRDSRATKVESLPSAIDALQEVDEAEFRARKPRHLIDPRIKAVPPSLTQGCCVLLLEGVAIEGSASNL